MIQYSMGTRLVVHSSTSYTKHEGEVAEVNLGLEAYKLTKIFKLSLYLMTYHTKQHFKKGTEIVHNVTRNGNSKYLRS